MCYASSSEFLDQRTEGNEVWFISLQCYCSSTVLYLLLFSVLQTTYHGFPSGPSALAYDAENQLLVLGTKFGELRVFGRPGVEFRALTTTKSAIKSILCVSAVHQLVTVSEDNSITLWELNTEGLPTLTVVKELTFDSERYGSVLDIRG